MSAGHCSRKSVTIPAMSIDRGARDDFEAMGAQRGQAEQPARGVSPLALECEASDMNAPSVAGWGDSPRAVAIPISRSATSLS